MKYNLAFKYRIYPNKDQELLINKTFGCVRFVYNTILYTANKFYEETGKNKIITPASLKNENQFLKEVDSLALSNAQLNVKRSFTNFFQKRAKFPKFKSKKNNVKSYTTNCVNNSIIPSNDKVIGLDFSMSELFVSSENQRADYPKYFRILEKKLKKLQKSLSRKVKFSEKIRQVNYYKILLSKYDLFAVFFYILLIISIKFWVFYNINVISYASIY